VPEQKNSAFADIPPDWVALTEAVDWVRRYFGVDITERASNIASDLRKGKLRYHVADLESDELYPRAYASYTVEFDFGRAASPAFIRHIGDGCGEPR